MHIGRRQAFQALAGSAVALAAQQTTRPNILFVLSDDHSFPYLGLYGADWISTPNLDRFGSEGLIFENAFTAAPQCVPSRVALMTGRSPVAARMGRFSAPLPADIISVPEVLRSQGYYTGVCGRYFHLDGVNNPQPATAQVYERYQLKTWKKRIDFLDVSGQAQTTSRFEQFLAKAQPGRPWFFWANFSDPHHPWTSGRRIDAGRVKVPGHLPDLPGIRGDLARYGAEIEGADRSFGDILSVLQNSGQESNTMVVFMGDNGMAFPRGKGSLYDAGLHVPLIVRHPRRIKAGRSQALVSGEDIAATFMDAGGASLPAGVSGQSFLPLLHGREYSRRRYVFAGRFHHGNASLAPESRASLWDLSRCVRSERYKLIYNLTPAMEYQPVDSARDPGWQEMIAAHREGKLPTAMDRAYFQLPRPVLELYDLEADPSELDNLAGKPELRDVQQTLMAAMQEKMILDSDYVPPVLTEGQPRRQAPRR